jgi:RNA polymerase sigma-70 factor (ECF subfamily)
MFAEPIRALVSGPSEASCAPSLGLRGLVGGTDPEAFGRFYNRYYPRVLRFVLYRLSDPAVAEEVANDTFFEFWRRASAFRGASRPSTWLFGIARFKCRASRRDGRRFKRSQFVATEPSVFHRVSDARRFEGRLQARSEMRGALRVIGELPPSQREVAVLAFQGLSTQEIAEDLRIAPGTVKSRLHDARYTLRARCRPDEAKR